MAEGPRIYNLFPLLAGPFPAWQPHLERAARMHFNWIFVNPVQPPGQSGSLYSIRDYYGVNPLLLDPPGGDAQAQLGRAVRSAHDLGMQIMIDLVINHTAVDSPLVAEHPEWYERDAAGQIVHPGAHADGQLVVWVDLASIDNATSADRENLWQYWLRVVLHYAALGFDGFRCDAAYQVPAELWRFLIHSARREFPGLRFFAETLGCTTEQTLEVARSGFDFIFNSSKWWDFSAPWCLEQYRQTSPVVPSVSFPESHDTERLAAELGGNHAAVRQRTAFAALFASGWMIPVGFEYGFRKRLHVVNTRPSDWEQPSWDDTDFIGWVNALKKGHRLWNEDGPMESLDTASSHIVALRKMTRDGAQRGLLLLNKDPYQARSLNLPSIETLLGARFALAWPQTAEATALPPAGFQVFASSDAQ